MRASNAYRDKSPMFWATVRFISESLGYSVTGRGIVKKYELIDISSLLREKNLLISHDELLEVKGYLALRADLLNTTVRENFMDAAAAKIEYERFCSLNDHNDFSCKQPLNKQKGNMRQTAYFTASINMLTEKTIKQVILQTEGTGFDDDPQTLVYLVDDNRNLLGGTSRRYDGAFPNTLNPKIVWEIKEYYYTTTFGSKIADGVYISQLDGYEFRDIAHSAGRHIEHVYFIDGYDTWWNKGRSYLCRIIDAMHMGLIDEVIVGKEIFVRWPELLRTFI